MEENQHIVARKDKIAALRAQNINPFPNTFKPKHSCAELSKRFETQDKEALEKVEERFSIAGRVMLLREFGKLAFCRVKDTTGVLQVSVTVDFVGDNYATFKKHVDVGDILAVEGFMTRTQKGELTLQAERFEIQNKSARPLPDKWHGLSDTETRYRQRYVDLIMNEDVKDVFKKRSQIISECRNFLEVQGFMEVETPMLHYNASGAAAKPFETHHNALSLDMKLRIAPELHLKRLVVGGFDRVFEINRNFRNEGVSVRHNPEFTMLEFYGAYMDYKDAMDLTSEMISTIAQKVCGTTELEYGEHKVSLQAPFKQLSMRNALLEIGGVKESDLETIDSLQVCAKSRGVQLSKWGDYGQAFMELFEELCEDKIINPTFIYDYPTSTSPLSRCHDDDPEWTQRAELFAVGREIGNLFSELNDPTDQANRFQDQIDQAKKGNDEAMAYDEDYIRALEYGMPPAAGVGVGIDRLVMLLTNQPSIRDVILFPHMRPEDERLAQPKTKAAGDVAGAVEVGPDTSDYRFVAVMNKKVDPAQAMNALGKMAAGLGAHFGASMATTTLKDGSEEEHPNLPAFPLVVLKADNANQIRKVRQGAKEGDVIFTDFNAAIAGGSPSEQRSVLQAAKEEDLDYSGICLFGPEDKVKALTKKFSLMR